MTWASARLAALAVVLLSERAAAAEGGPGTTAVHLEVRAAPACATEPEVASRVLARAPRIRFASDGAAFAVRAEFTVLQPGEVLGEIVMVGPGAKPSLRRIVTHTCQEALDAVALIVALTLEPASTGGREEAATSTTRAADDASRSASAPRTPAEPPALLPEPPPAEAGRPTGPPKTAAVVRPSEPSAVLARGQLGLDLAAQAFVGPAPGVMPGATLYGTAALDRSSLWSPAVLVGATHAWRTGLAEQGGTASFALDVVTVDACPARLRLAVIEARACASALVGLLSSRGADTREPATVSRPFAATGASAVLNAPASSTFALSVRLAAVATLVRDSFEFASVTFYRVAPVTLSGSLGFGVRVP